MSDIRVCKRLEKQRLEGLVAGIVAGRVLPYLNVVLWCSYDLLHKKERQTDLGLLLPVPLAVSVPTQEYWDTVPCVLQT